MKERKKERKRERKKERERKKDLNDYYFLKITLIFKYFKFTLNIKLAILK